MDKLNLVYTKEYYSFIKSYEVPCCDMNELWKHYAKWKKSDTKRQILCDSIYLKYPVYINT